MTQQQKEYIEAIRKLKADSEHEIAKTLVKLRDQLDALTGDEYYGGMRIEGVSFARCSPSGRRFCVTISINTGI